MQNEHIILDFINSNNQLADIFTMLMKKVFAKIGLSLVLLIVIYLEFYNFVYNFLRHVFRGATLSFLLYYFSTVIFDDYKEEKIKKNIYSKFVVL